MILVDTSVWIDHIRRPELELARYLTANQVLVHPFVVGEIALGVFAPRAPMLENLKRLPSPVLAGDGEVLTMIESERLFGVGIGYVAAHLLAAARLTPGASVWTRDRRLARVVERLGLAPPP
ncbi:MAG: type II toxin-antitoxin system VapC family toxin [Caulobacteraceae bacterium]